MKLVNSIDYSLTGFKDLGYGLCGRFFFFSYLKPPIRKEAHSSAVKHKPEMYYSIHRV